MEVRKRCPRAEDSLLPSSLSLDGTGGPGYLAEVRNVVVVMVNHSCLLLVELNPTLAAQLSKRVTCTDPRNAWLSPGRCTLGPAMSLVSWSRALPVTPTLQLPRALSPSQTADHRMVF